MHQSRYYGSVHRGANDGKVSWVEEVIACPGFRRRGTVEAMPRVVADIDSRFFCIFDCPLYTVSMLYSINIYT